MLCKFKKQLAVGSGADSVRRFCLRASDGNNHAQTNNPGIKEVFYFDLVGH